MPAPSCQLGAPHYSSPVLALQQYPRAFEGRLSEHSWLGDLKDNPQAVETFDLWIVRRAGLEALIE
jgi:hypothetical protein